MTVESVNATEFVEPPVKLKFGEVGLRRDGIFQIQIYPSEIVGLKEMLEIHAVKERFSEGKKIPNLVLMGKHSTADKEGRAFSVSEKGSRFRNADAFVITSLAQKIVANFYLKIEKPRVPTRFFNKADEAVEWLKQFL